MSRKISKKAIEAKKMFDDGMTMVEIAKRLGVCDSTVRSWKNRYGWEDKPKKRKRGGQPHNQNAKGGPGNPHPVTKISPQAALKHGAYSRVYLDTLTTEEYELLCSMPEDEEILLLEQIALFYVRERRILLVIKKYQEMESDVAVDEINRTENRRSFKNADEEDSYNRRQQAKVDNGEILPGRPYNLQTRTVNKDMFISRLEQELTTVQGKKTKAIEALAKVRTEKAKLAAESVGNDIVDDWISAILEKNEGKR